MSNSLLFAICVLIWGSTWLAITYQLGDTHPIHSVGLRFAIAVLMLGAYVFWKGLTLRFSWQMHLRIAAIGLGLYCLNYAFVYASQQYLISAVVALMSSTILYFNVLFRRLFLKKPIRYEVVIGATIGVLGLYLVFLPELSNLQSNDYLYLGVSLAGMSFICASLGNILSESTLDKGLPVIQMNFLAMSYAVVFTFSYAALIGIPFVLSEELSYWLSLGYLGIFGSVIAFTAYMKLVQQMGSDKSGYVILMYPIVALVLSTFFEDYMWTMTGVLGVVCILFGNAVAMNKVMIVNRVLNRFATNQTS